MALPRNPLVWIDCEMTGLDLQKDKLLEVAVIITDGNLEAVDNGIEFVIQTDKETLDGMGDWCTQQHRNSGLTNACLTSPYTRQFAEESVLAYIQKWIPKKNSGVLAGNSVHVDRSFLIKEMPSVIDWLHYRIVDVSTIKELCYRWYAGHYAMPKKGESEHRALGDIRGSIQGKLLD